MKILAQISNVSVSIYTQESFCFIIITFSHYIRKNKYILAYILMIYEFTQIRVQHYVGLFFNFHLLHTCCWITPFFFVWQVAILYSYGYKSYCNKMYPLPTQPLVQNQSIVGTCKCNFSQIQSLSKKRRKKFETCVLAIMII